MNSNQLARPLAWSIAALSLALALAGLLVNLLARVRMPDQGWLDVHQIIQPGNHRFVCRGGRAGSFAPAAQPDRLDLWRGRRVRRADRARVRVSHVGPDERGAAAGARPCALARPVGLDPGHAAAADLCAAAVPRRPLLVVALAAWSAGSPAWARRHVCSASHCTRARRSNRCRRATRTASPAPNRRWSCCGWSPPFACRSAASAPWRR